MRSIKGCLYALAIVIAVIIVRDVGRVDAAQTDDEAALRLIAQRYAQAYAAEDLSAMMILWSRRSKDIAARFESLMEGFDKSDVTISNVEVTSIKIRGVSATIRLSADASTRAKDGGTRREALERNLALVKEQGRWQIWSDVPASEPVEDFFVRGSDWKTSSSLTLEEQFASALIEASSDYRRALLTDNPEMVTLKLKDALFKQADTFLRNRVPKMAMDGYLLAQEIAVRFADKSGAATAQLGIAQTRRASNDRRQSIQEFEKARALFDELGDKARVAAIWSEIAKTHSQMGEPDRAVESHKKALAVFEGISDRAKAADTMEDISTIYRQQERYGEALNLLLRCLALREALGRPAEVANTLRKLGNLHYYQEKYEASIDYYLKAVARFESLKDERALAETMSYLASASYAIGNYDVALEHYRKALVLQEGFRDSGAAASSLYGLGSTYIALGDFTNALSYLHKNLLLLEAANDNSRIVDTMRLTGFAYVKLGNLDAGRAAYERGLGIYEEHGDKHNAAELLVEIGNVNFAQVNYDAAVGRFSSALSYFEALKNTPGVAVCYNALGSVDYARRLYDPALDFYQKSLALYESLGKKEAIASTLENMAGVNFARGDYTKSLELADRSAATARDARSQQVLWKARYTAGIANRELNQLNEARMALEESISIIEELRSQQLDTENAPPFFHDKTDPYLVMMELLLSENDIVAAFNFAERVKSHSLWDTLRGARLRITRGMTAQQQRQERQLNKTLLSLSRIAERQRQLNNPVVSLPQLQRDKRQQAESEAQSRVLEARVRRARTEYESFKKRLYTARPALRLLRGEILPMKGEEVGRMLDPRTALLNFVVTDARSLLFVATLQGATGKIRRTNLQVYVVNLSRADLATRVAGFRTLIEQRSEETSRVGRELYDLLLAPAASQLQGKRLLVVSPDSALWGLPFQALMPAGSHYLIEESELVYAPSWTAYRALSRIPATRRRSAAGLQVSAFANPHLADETLSRVALLDKDKKIHPAADSDSRLTNLLQLYGEKRVRIYSGLESSEENLKAISTTCRVLRIDSPVVLSDSSPLHSPVLLARSAPNGNEDGWLQAWEIVGLKVRAELVLVSTSEVAVRGRSGGEAVIGLAWAWLPTGTSAVLLSQWEVHPDESDFLLELHRQLQENSPSRALRLASLKALTGEFGHPFYWSRFVVLGRGN